MRPGGPVEALGVDGAERDLRLLAARLLGRELTRDLAQLILHGAPVPFLIRRQVQPRLDASDLRDREYSVLEPRLDQGLPGLRQARRRRRGGGRPAQLRHGLVRADGRRLERFGIARRSLARRGCARRHRIGAQQRGIDNGGVRDRYASDFAIVRDGASQRRQEGTLGKGRGAASFNAIAPITQTRDIRTRQPDRTGEQCQRREPAQFHEPLTCPSGSQHCHVW